MTRQGWSLGSIAPAVGAIPCTGRRNKVKGSKQRKSRFKFVGDTISELKKVVWPPRQEATRLTIIVLIVSIAIGLILGMTDFGFANLADRVLLR